MLAAKTATTHIARCNSAQASARYRSPKGQAAYKKLMEDGYFRFGNGAISALRQGANKRNLNFDLTPKTLETWWRSVPDRCFYCGIQLSEYLEVRDFIVGYSGRNYEIIKFKRFYRSPKHQAIRWMTIDRMKNDLGYQLDNIVKSCWICNSLKNDFFDAGQMKMVAPEIIDKLRGAIAREKA